MRKFCGLALAAMLLCATGARAQAESETGPRSGSHELQIWAAGGHTVPGGVTSSSVWNAGARYGWVLSDLHGPGFLRGRFEYAVDAIPLVVIAEPAHTTYGASLDPLVLRWNFQQRHRIMPYFELTGGVVFLDREVPAGSGRVDFTPSTGIGISVPRGRFRWSAELHYLHISNSGLTKNNPGINTLQLRIGFGLFKKRAE